MNLKKTVAIAAAAGALAAISVPAMAFENEFHGLYILKGVNSNIENGNGSSFYAPGTTQNGLVTPEVAKKQSNTYFEQRARIFYTAKANDDLKLVTGFELDARFGDTAQGSATRNGGGALESDAVSLETKHVYLDFNIPSTKVNVKAGIQPVKDAIKGVFFDADVAGIKATAKAGKATITGGFYRAYDQALFTTSNATKGTQTLDIYAVEADYAISKDAKLGLAYYLYSDDRNTSWTTGAAINPGTTNIHTFAVNGEAKAGKATISGFFAMQQGLSKANSPAATNTAAISNGTTYNGMAANVAAKFALGKGVLRTALLYTSGDDGKDGINTGWQAVTQNQNTTTTNALSQSTQASTNSYNEGGMMLLNRNAADHNTNTDRSLVNSTNNLNQGLWLYTLGYDATITPKLSASANVGFAWVARSNANHASDLRVSNTEIGRNGSNYLGTEFNAAVNYKMYDNLTASLQGAYVVLGSYYANSARDARGAISDPDNPYTTRVVLTYAF